MFGRSLFNGRWLYRPVGCELTSIGGDGKSVLSESGELTSESEKYSLGKIKFILLHKKNYKNNHKKVTKE